MRIVYLWVIAFITLPFISCQSDAPTEAQAEIVTENKNNSTHVFAKFYVRYLQTEKELKAEATFLEGDTLDNARPIILNKVFFKDQEMQVQQLGNTHGIRYNFRNKGPHSKQYTFSFFGNQTGDQEHNMEMEPINDFLIKEGRIQKNKGLTLVWKGKPLDEAQELVLLFTDENKKAFPVQIKGPTDRPELNLSPDQVIGLSPGKGQLMVIKKQLKQSINENLTVFSEMEFYSNPLDIEVIN